MDETQNKKQFIRTFRFPLFLIFVLLFIKVLELISDTSFAPFGIHPRHANGLAGIFFSPLIHSDWSHLLNNAIPLLVLTSTLMYFYRRIALQILALIWIVTDLCVWIGGREAYHIGASGVIYGLASFLFFSGIFRKEIRLLAISLMVIFLYGSMVWGIFPFFPDVSWESHLFGMLSGLFFAVVYKKEGYVKKDEPEEEDEPDGYPYWEIEADEDEKQTLN